MGKKLKGEVLKQDRPIFGRSYFFNIFLLFYFNRLTESENRMVHTVDRTEST